MVKSKLNKKIVYEEDRKIEGKDIDYETSVYEVNIVKYHKRVKITLGKENLLYEPEGVLYYNIYLIDDDDNALYKIGIFELAVRDKKIFENTEDIENYGNILWFSNLTESEINNVSIDYDSDVSDIVDDSIVAGQYGKKINNFRNIIIGNEDKEFANKVRSYFVSDVKRNNWVQEFMKNANYDLVDNEGDGDCFFCVLRDAFKYAGVDISVSTMRNLLSKEADETLFLNYKEQYDMYSKRLMEDKKKLKVFNKKYKELEKDAMKVDDKKKKLKLMNSMEKIKLDHDKLKDEMNITEELLQEFIFMNEIHNMNDFRRFILKKDFWADTWVVSTIERILNVKCILMSSDAYEQEDKDNVIHCNQLNDDLLSSIGEFNPDFYIIMDYNGYHYQLIRYSKKGILKFNELPYDLKNLILYKCLEGENGPYNIIPDFLKLKKERGFSTKTTTSDVDLDNIYSSTTIFQIYNKSSDKLPGKGKGESINEEDITKYSNLKKIKDWRRKLSHMWPIELEIDGNTFQSVEHYVQANKFTSYPDFYKQFSLESKSTLSLSPEKAYSMGLSNSSIRDKKYKIDPSFSTNYDDIIEKALRKKFVSNIEFKKMLKETHDSKIMEYKRASKPRVMNELIRLRKEIRK